MPLYNTITIVLKKELVKISPSGTTMMENVNEATTLEPKGLSENKEPQ